MVGIIAPIRAYGPGVDRSQKNVRVVYSEADIQRALTAAYKNPKALSVIRLGADIVMKKPVTVDPPGSTWKGVVIDGAGQFSISTGAAMAYMFSTRSIATTKGAAFTRRLGGLALQDVTLIVNHAVEYIVKTAGTRPRLGVRGLSVFIDAAVTGVFGLKAASSGVTLDDVAIEATSTGLLGHAIIGVDGSTVDGLRCSSWSMSRVASFVDNPGSATTITSCSFYGVTANSSVVVGSCSSCLFVGFTGFTNVDVNEGGTGTSNMLVGFSVAAGTMNIDASDVVTGQIGYTVTGTGDVFPGASGGWTTVTKLATDTIQSDNTPNNDDELLFAMLANTTYRFRAVVHFTTDVTAGLDTIIAGPAAPTRVSIRKSIPASGTDDGQVTTFASSYAATGGANAGTIGAILFEGVVENGANAGNLVIAWSQDVSQALDTSILKGSYIEHAVVA